MEEKQQQLEKLKNTNAKLLIAVIILFIVLLILMVLNNILPNYWNNCRGGGSTMSKEQYIKQFNAEFTPYLGENISAQQAKSLISAVKTSNGRNAEHQVKNIYIEEINGEVYEGKPTMSRISTKSEYSAEELYDKEGYIKQITITKK